MSQLSQCLITGSAPPELSAFVSGCASDDDLVEKLKKDPSRLLSIIQNIKVEGNGSLAARLLQQVNPKDLEDPVVKKVETMLRDKGVINRGVAKLKNLCDDKLCNSLSLGEISIEKRDMKAWLEQSDLAPKFAMLLRFVNRGAGSDNLVLRLVNRFTVSGGLGRIISIDEKKVGSHLKR